MDTVDHTLAPPSKGLGVKLRMDNANSSAAAKSYSRVLPISSLRFILALIVLIGHTEFPFLREPQHNPILWAVRALLRTAFNGPAAVVVFFVISGFCIHFPNRAGLSMPSWKAYYARRYIRILIPMAAALLLALPLRFPFNLFHQSILWSLLCEEIYYFLYPLFLTLQRQFGWSKLLAVAGVLSLCVILTDPRAKDYPGFGPGLNWLLGLPCWLLGCHLAARFEVIRLRNVDTIQIWGWRAGAWVLSVIAAILTFHTPVGHPWTLNLFAVYSLFWMEREIAYYHDRPAPWFEGVGEASYSIYLVHQHGFNLAVLMGSLSMSLTAGWAFTLATAAVFATLFYLLVERPSHKLARRIGRVRTPRPVLAVASARAGLGS